MTKNKVTIQDIADALGLSRTTVSKVLNEAEGMPPKTVERVIEKAKEMRYKHFADHGERSEEKGDSGISKPIGNVALLVHVMPNHFYIASTLMISLEQELGREGYSLTIHVISDENIKECTLPNNFFRDCADAIICMELFDRSYCNMLCTLKKPILFSDSYCFFRHEELSADLIMMENEMSVYNMLTHIISKTGIQKVGYVGDYNHCLSFHERYKGYKKALRKSGLKNDPAFSIIDDDFNFFDENWIEEKLRQMEVRPDMLFCANDILALKVINGCERLNWKIPEDIMVCGFDGTPALAAVNSILTTVQTPSFDMGKIAASILINKIKNPQLPCQYTYLKTNIIYNKSTDRQ